MHLKTAWDVVAILGVCSSTAAPGETPASADSFMDRVEKCSSDTEAFFGSWLYANEPAGIPEEDRGSESYKAFGRFMALAGQARDADIEECIASLPTASPRTAALLLAVLFHQNELRVLPAIARSLDDKRVAFRYQEGSPDSRYALRIGAGFLPAPGLLQKEQSVADIARMLLRWWGFYETQETFEQFWEARKDRPYSAMELYLQRRRAKDEITGEPKQEQIAGVIRRIEGLAEPARSLLRLAVALPMRKSDRGLHEADRRKAVAALSRQTVTAILDGQEPIIPGDPDVGPQARNPLYECLVDAIIKHRDVHFTDAEFTHVMTHATGRAKVRVEMLKGKRE